MTPRLDPWTAAPKPMMALLAYNNAIAEAGLEPSLIHLVKLRASLINGCAFCIELHTREALADGDTPARLGLISAWHESFLFSEEEKVALAWTEAVTRLGPNGPDDDLFARAQKAFGDEKLVVLTLLVTVINAWNGISIAVAAVHADPADAA